MPEASPKNAGVDWDSLFKQLARDYKNEEKVLRLIAWSYQYDAQCFEFMRKAFYDRYVKCSGDLETMEITFCANNFPSNDIRVEGILGEVIFRISEGQYNIISPDMDPEYTLLMKEIFNYIRENESEIFSPMEVEVWYELMSGKNYREIAENMEKEPKIIDNAVQRIKKKVHAYLQW